MDEAPTYSISVRLQRTTTEETYLSVPVDEAIMQDEPAANGNYRIDPPKLWAEAIRLAEQSADWTLEHRQVTPHPIQRAPSWIAEQHPEWRSGEPRLGEPRFGVHTSSRAAAPGRTASFVPVDGQADHWLTDIVYWKRPAFGEPQDSMIREIVHFGGRRLLDDGTPLSRTLNRLWVCPPNDEQQRTAELEKVAHVLQSLRDQVRQKAIDNGWEVSETSVEPPGSNT
jgi:hypothetical protein